MLYAGIYHQPNRSEVVRKILKSEQHQIIIDTDSAASSQSAQSGYSVQSNSTALSEIEGSVSASKNQVNLFIFWSLWNNNFFV